MIELSNPLAPDGGDITQIDTTNLKNNAIVIDPVNGMGIWRKALNSWLFLSGNGVSMLEVIKTNADLKYDATIFQWYLELNVDAVFSCEINGVSNNGQLDKTFSPARYFNSFGSDSDIQTIKLFVKI